MKKKCQIHAVYPITCFSVPIVGHTELNLTTDEIYKCLCGKAEVAEILPNGKIINLDFTNYDKNNYVKEEPKPLETVTTEHIEEDVTEEQSEDELEIVTEVETSTEEEVKVEESPVKTHEVGSRNNNKNNNHNKNRKNNKR